MFPNRRKKKNTFFPKNIGDVLRWASLKIYIKQIIIHTQHWKKGFLK